MGSAESSASGFLLVAPSSRLVVKTGSAKTKTKTKALSCQGLVFRSLRQLRHYHLPLPFGCWCGSQCDRLHDSVMLSSTSPYILARIGRWLVMCLPRWKTAGSLQRPNAFQQSDTGSYITSTTLSNVRASVTLLKQVFRPAGRLVAPIQVKLCRTDGHLGPLTCAKFYLNRHRGVGIRPQKI